MTLAAIVKGLVIRNGLMFRLEILKRKGCMTLQVSGSPIRTGVGPSGPCVVSVSVTQVSAEARSYTNAPWVNTGYFNSTWKCKRAHNKQWAAELPWNRHLAVSKWRLIFAPLCSPVVTCHSPVAYYHINCESVLCAPEIRFPSFSFGFRSNKESIDRSKFLVQMTQKVPGFFLNKEEQDKLFGDSIKRW